MSAQHLKTALLAGIVLFMAFTGCKKGEDDPAFTLVTRRARVAGDWTLKEGNFTIGVKDSSGAHGAIVYTFNNSSCDSSSTYKGVTQNINFNFTASFTKSGDVSFTQQIGKTTLSAGGTWDFLGAQGDFNNKERMTIQLNHVDGYMNRSDFFNKGEATFTYRIKELRSSKMVLVTEQELQAIDKSGFSYFITSEYVLVQ